LRGCLSLLPVKAVSPQLKSIDLVWLVLTRNDAEWFALLSSKKRFSMKDFLYFIWGRVDWCL